MWAKCNFIFKNCTNRPSGTVNSGGSTPQKSSEWHIGWHGKAKLYVWWGVYHWKSMKVQGVESWTALYFVVQGRCVSLEVFLSSGKSHNVSVPKMKGLELLSFGTFSTPGFCEDWAWMLLGGSYLCFLFFHSWKDLKTKMIMGNGSLNRNKVHL